MGTRNRIVDSSSLMLHSSMARVVVADHCSSFAHPAGSPAGTESPFDVVATPRPVAISNSNRSSVVVDTHTPPLNGPSIVESGMGAERTHAVTSKTASTAPTTCLIELVHMRRPHQVVCHCEVKFLRDRSSRGRQPRYRGPVAHTLQVERKISQGEPSERLPTPTTPPVPSQISRPVRDRPPVPSRTWPRD
jgi:hypothetical protein